MANQPLLRNWPRKLLNSSIYRNIMAITLFKVTDFGTNRKLICDFLLVINTNLFLSCTVSKLWLIIGQIFASDRGMLHFDAFVDGDSLQISR